MMRGIIRAGTALKVIFPAFDANSPKGFFSVTFKSNWRLQNTCMIVAFREKPKSFSHKLQKSTTFCKLAKNKRAFERYFISYQTPFYLFIIMAHPVCIPVYLKYHNSMPYKFGQDDSG